MIATLLGALRLALGAIARNKTRAVLTVLGILIGITAVVIVTALAESTSAARGRARSTASRRTPSTCCPSRCRPRAPEQVRRAADRERRPRHRARGRERRGVAPWLVTQGQVVYGDKNVVDAPHRASRCPYYQIRRWTIARGRELDRERRAPQDQGVRPRGRRSPRTSSAPRIPIGRTIRIGRSPYQVIGLLGRAGRARSATTRTTAS